jgi:very-short-patch-repair endonuclease
MYVENIPYEQIKLHYEFITPLIIERSAKHPAGWISPYGSDIHWKSLFSPIEADTWQAIRCFGKVPLYPQYPVLNYFLDFGNPYLKIGIECDGKEFHLDKEKDMRRDTNLRKLGWRIYRVSGSDCVRPIDSEYYKICQFSIETQLKILSEYYHTTMEGLLKALAIKYFKYKYFYIGEGINERRIAMSCLRARLSEVYEYS